MISTVHMMTGAAVASVTGQWWAVTVIPVILHYLEDMIPHADPSIKTWPLRWWLVAASIDFLLGIGLVLYIWPGEITALLVLAVLMGIMPDVLSILDYFFPTKFGVAYRRWHKSLQAENYSWLGYLTQIAVFGLAVYLIRTQS